MARRPRRRVVALDLHSLQTIGYFDIPVDHIYGECVLLDYLNSKAGARSRRAP